MENNICTRCKSIEEVYPYGESLFCDNCSSSYIRYINYMRDYSHLCETTLERAKAGILTYEFATNYITDLKKPIFRFSLD